MEYRPLGSSGLRVPAVGMGTWKTFDVVYPEEIEQRRTVVDVALEHGCNLFDSSPMYGAAERVLSAALEGRRDQAIVATKVWSPDDNEATEQIRTAFEYFGGYVEIYQVHNLVAWEKRLSTLEYWRDQGRIKSVGVTHYQHSAFPEMMQIMRSGRVTMIQVPYNVEERVVERDVLPLAAELDIGVLIMRPLGRGVLAAKSPPAESLESLAPFGVKTWPQALLKWILSDTRVTSVLPATTSTRHAQHNAEAGDPPWFGPDEREYVARLAERHAG
jgi:aryl-alcohol dehydrogenase-like predicted oxidoreductase